MAAAAATAPSESPETPATAKIPPSTARNAPSVSFPFILSLPGLPGMVGQSPTYYFKLSLGLLYSIPFLSYLFLPKDGVSPYLRHCCMELCGILIPGKDIGLLWIEMRGKTNDLIWFSRICQGLRVENGITESSDNNAHRRVSGKETAYKDHGAVRYGPIVSAYGTFPIVPIVSFPYSLNCRGTDSPGLLKTIPARKLVQHGNREKTH